MQILSQTEVWRWWPFFRIAIPITAFAFVILLVFAIATKNENCIAAAMTMFAVPLILIYFGSLSNAHCYNDYKVTLDESISAKEFLSKYELLNIDGEIYEIREYITE